MLHVVFMKTNGVLLDKNGGGFDFIVEVQAVSAKSLSDSLLHPQKTAEAAG